VGGGCCLRHRSSCLYRSDDQLQNGIRSGRAFAQAVAKDIERHNGRTIGYTCCADFLPDIGLLRASAPQTAHILAGLMIWSRVEPYDSPGSYPFTEENDGHSFPASATATRFVDPQILCCWAACRVNPMASQFFHKTIPQTSYIARERARFDKRLIRPPSGPRTFRVLRVLSCTNFTQAITLTCNFYLKGRLRALKRE
jgi:hypothetical protein